MDKITMSILPPELEANYELLEEVHEGGMGAVYKARHRHLDERCVIKVMHPRLNDIAGARDRFFKEAKRGKQLRHRNIAEVLAFFVGTDGKAYLVMEYVDGQNLYEILTRQGPLNSQLLVTIGVQALSALAYLHSRQIIHRDISPDNLMLTTAGTGPPLVKLIDLGIAKSLDETMGLTGTGLFIGKVHYASPEQFRQNVDARSDLYSLAVVLYELATGVSPVRETDTMAIIAASMRDEPPRPFAESDPKGRVPSALRAVILKGLEKKPGNRYQTADNFSEALQRALGPERTTVVDSMPATEPMDAPIIPPAPPTLVEPVAIFPRVAIGAVLLLALAAFGAFRIMRTPDAAPQRPTVASTVVPGTTPTVTSPETSLTTTSSGTSVTVTSPQPTTPERRQLAAKAMTRGKQLTGERKIEEAYAAFAEATQADPGDAFAWANFGGAAALLGKPDEARAAYERALAVDPSNWLAHYNLACQLAGSGARDKALQHLGVAVAQLRLQARSHDELNAVMSSIRADEALRVLQNDSEFTKLLATD